MNAESLHVDLSGQVAIVTGGRGLGRSMARALAAAGAAVAVAARSEAEIAETVSIIENNGGHAIAVKVDVTDWAGVQNMVQEVEQKLGPIDLLVNNAGQMGKPGPIWETDPDQWRQILNVNLCGPFLCTRAVLPGMVRRHHGRIINVASYAATIPVTYGSAYCISKAALVRFTECVAADSKDQGTAIFAINPGTVHTAMTEYLLESEEGKKWTPWMRTLFEEGRDVPPERSAKLVVLLASGKADTLSGSYIEINDDLDSLIQRADQIQHDELHRLRMRR
jgi:NAD(P)-dependent dehydrogenase (short-subunit alcohol dehydrogenase family)